VVKRLPSAQVPVLPAHASLTISSITNKQNLFFFKFSKNKSMMQSSINHKLFRVCFCSKDVFSQDVVLQIRQPDNKESICKNSLRLPVYIHPDFKALHFEE